MKREKKFWRLLGDYERLCTDEAVVLRELNFAALAELQRKKTTVCEAVLALARRAGITLPAGRFQRLLAKQRANLALAEQQLVRMSCERQNLAAVGQRLVHVGRAYKKGVANPSAFKANG